MKINILFKYLDVFVLFYSFCGNAEVIGYKKDELDTKLCVSGRLDSINGISWDIKGLGKLYLYNFRYETEFSLNSFDDIRNKADKNMELIGNVNRYINVFDFHLDRPSTFVEPIKDEFSFYGDVIFISKNKYVDMFWLNKNKNATLASDILLTTSQYDGAYIGGVRDSYQKSICEYEIKEFELKNVDEVYYIRENITNNTPFFIKLELKNKIKMTFELKTKGLIDLIKNQIQTS